MSRIAHDPTTERRPLVQAGGFSIPEKIYHNSRKVFQSSNATLAKKDKDSSIRRKRIYAFPFSKKKDERNKEAD